MYAGNAVTFQIKLASLIPVVNAYREIMTKGETVTLLNDMCALAPVTLIAPSIQWETIDPLTVKATFTNQGYTISALLSFNQTGELTNFVSDDRYQQVKGNTFANYRWSIPLKDYQEINGHKLYASSEKLRSEPLPPAAWHQASEISYWGNSAHSVWKHLASNAKVIWHMPKGEFVYAHYHVSSLAYNVQKFSA